MLKDRTQTINAAKYILDARACDCSESNRCVRCRLLDNFADDVAALAIQQDEELAAKVEASDLQDRERIDDLLREHEQSFPRNATGYVRAIIGECRRLIREGK